MAGLSRLNLFRGLERAEGAGAAPLSVQDFEKIDPDSNYAPALHEDMSLPWLFEKGFNYYTERRDSLSPSKTPLSPGHVGALEDSAIFVTPGWGNHKFAHKIEARAAALAGFGYTFLSVSRDGCVKRGDKVTLVGSPKMSLTAEWLKEVPTVLLRYFFALKLHAKDRGNRPDRNIHIGHSKGGLVNYVMACLRQSYRDGGRERLSKFANDLRDQRGMRVLDPAVFTTEILEALAKELSNDAIGSVGSPLYEIAESYAAFADFSVGGLGFNKVFENCAAYYSREYLQNLQRMTGYAPHEVLDFAVTTKLHTSGGAMQKLLRGATLLARAVKNPIIEGPNAVFHFAGLAIEREKDHDGIAGFDYPAEFGDKHIAIPGATHLDQSGEEWLLDHIIDSLLKRRIL